MSSVSRRDQSICTSRVENAWLKDDVKSASAGETDALRTPQRAEAPSVLPQASLTPRHHGEEQHAASPSRSRTGEIVSHPDEFTQGLPFNSDSSAQPAEVLALWNSLSAAEKQALVSYFDGQGGQVNTTPQPGPVPGHPPLTRDSVSLPPVSTCWLQS